MGVKAVFTSLLTLRLPVSEENTVFVLRTKNIVSLEFAWARAGGGANSRQWRISELKL